MNNDEKIVCKEVWQNPTMNFYGKPMLLFVTKSWVKIDGIKTTRVRIHGYCNPLPFKNVYGISFVSLDSWLKDHLWQRIGYEN